MRSAARLSRRASVSLGQPHLRLRLRHPGPRLRERRPQLLGLDLGQEIALAHRGAFVHEDAHEPSRALGRDHDLAAGVGDDAALRGDLADGARGRDAAARAPGRRLDGGGAARLERGGGEQADPDQARDHHAASSSLSPSLALSRPAGRPGSPPRGRPPSRTFGSWVTMTSPWPSLFARSRKSSRICGAHRGVEVGRRLVGQDHGRRAGQRAGDGHPLLLAAREVAGQEVQPVAEPDRARARAAPPAGAPGRRSRPSR